jgi:hypothetical protein
MMPPIIDPSGSAGLSYVANTRPVSTVIVGRFEPNFVTSK